MLILHVIVGLGNGGAEKTLAKICLGDAKNEHHVVSLTTQGHYGPFLRNSGVPTTALRFHPFGFVRTVKRLVGIFRELSPDVVHSWMPHSIFVSWLAGLFIRSGAKPGRVWGLRATDYGRRFEAIPARVMVRLLARISRWDDIRVVAVAARAKETHIALGFSPQKISVIPNGYEDIRRTPAEKKGWAEYQIRRVAPEATPIIGCVARFHPQKDHYSLLDALALLAQTGHKFCAVLVGEGVTEENQPLRNYVKQKGLDDYVLLLGPVEDPMPVFAALSIHVLPSAFGEGFPNAVAESMSAGVPNVVTDVGDSRLLVGKLGWVVEPRDAAALAAALAEALAMGPNKLRELGQQAKSSIASRFPETRMIQQYAETYRSVAGKARSSRRSLRGLRFQP